MHSPVLHFQEWKPEFVAGGGEGVWTLKKERCETVSLEKSSMPQSSSKTEEAI